MHRFHLRIPAQPFGNPLRRLPIRPWHRVWLAANLALVALFWSGSQVLAASPFQDGGVQANQQPEILAAFVPLLAAAAAVERAMEIGWNYLEWFLVGPLRWPSDALKRPAYRQFKSGTSMLVAAIIGIVVIHYSNMRLLAHLQPILPSLLGDVPDLWDISLTGLLVGAGSKPAHDLLGLITRFKNFVGNSALRQREEAGAALAEYVMKLGQAEAAARLEASGAGPATRGAAPKEPDPQRTQRYIETVRRRLDQDYQ